MANSLLGMIISTDYRNKGVVAAQNALKGLGGQVRNVGESLGIFNLSGLASAGIVVGAAKAVQKAVGNYVAYNDQIRQMANLTSMSAEDTSRLAQVADDYGVSMEQLNTIMEGAIKKGFEPSIDNLAKLSDEYLALNDPVERNQLLIDKLGKSGLKFNEVMKLGGAAIKDKAAAVADGMSVDEAALAASQEYKLAVDDLEDTFTAFANQLGKETLPVLVKVIDFFLKGFEAGTKLKNMGADAKGVWDEHNVVMQGVATTYEEYTTEMERAAEATGFNWEETTLLNDGITDLGTKQDFLKTNWGMLTELQWENRDASQAWMDELDRGGPIMEEVAAGAESLLTPIDSLKVSMGELTAQMIYQQAAAGLDAETSLLLARELGVLDERTYAAMNQVQGLKEQFDAGKISADQLVEGVGNIGEAYFLIPKEIVTSMIFDVKVTGDPIPAAAGDIGLGGDAPVTYATEEEVVYGGMRAAGGPVSADKWYWVGEHGPEPFFPGQAGTILPNGGGGGAGVVINWNGNVRSDTDIELIARKLADLMQRRR